MKNSRKNIYYLLTFFLLSIYGCIDEYKPRGIQSVYDIFVVEGTITNEESIFKLSKSVALDGYFSGKEFIDDAILYVESDKGERFREAIYIENGNYTIRTGTLQAGVQYRLHITWRGEEYASEFLSPLFTPEIESISIQKAGRGEPVFICVSTEDRENQSPYFRWTYKEDWEVQAPLYANGGYIYVDDEWKYTYYNLTDSNNTFYCWGRDSTRVFLLESCEKLSTNRVELKKLIEMEPSDDRLSVLYYNTIEQMLIRKDAFEYFSNLQKNLDQTGGLFASMPSETRGNVHSLTNPEKVIIGYIEVTTITRKEISIQISDGLYEYVDPGCNDVLSTEPLSGYSVYYLPDVGSLEKDTLYAPVRCVDCRYKKLASKIRPDNWPLEHY